MLSGNKLSLIIWVSVVFWGTGHTAAAKTLNCRENCQFFDGFNRRCNYRTFCGIEGEHLIYKFCEKYDSFYEKCVSESQNITPFKANLHVAPPACEELCQYLDNFTGNCLYRTRCEFGDFFTLHTECEKWDEFSATCDSELKTLLLSIY